MFAKFAVRSPRVRVINSIRRIIALFALVACSDTPSTAPQSSADSFVLVTVVGNSTYVGSFRDLAIGTTTNADAFEDESFAYQIAYRNWVFTTPIQGGDAIRRYDRAPEGKLTRGPRLQLPPSAVVGDIKCVSEMKCYASLRGLARLTVFNPTTMTRGADIDLSSLGIGDANPDPGIIVSRSGKLLVALLQLKGFIDAHPVSEMAIIDQTTDRLEGKVTDSRLHSASFYGRPGSVFTDESGDLYVYHTAGFGYIPGLKGGFLRMRNGQNTYDTGYLFDFTAVTVAGVPGGKVDYLNNVVYAGNGIAYGIANVPTLISNPPDYVNDRSFVPVRINLAARTIEVLAGLPRGNGTGNGLAIQSGSVVFGLDAREGVGLFRYNIATGTGSTTPVVSTQGAPWGLLVY